MNSGGQDIYTTQRQSHEAALRAKDQKITALEAVINGLECDAEWCGKSPRGTLGKRGYDDGKCDVCKAKAALEPKENER